MELDLADLSSVRRAAETIQDNIAVIVVLFDNAGVLAVEDYNKSADGYELQFASNHLSRFLLANLLAEKLFAAAQGARIIDVMCDAYSLEGMRFDDWNFSVINSNYQDFFPYI